MRRFGLWFILIMIVCAGVACASIGYGQRQLYPSSLPALGFCEGAPCYFGITPGLTSWEKAKSDLADLLLPETDDTPITMKGFITPDINGLIGIENADPAVVAVIMLSPSFAKNNFPTLGELLLFYGTPCSVYTEWSGYDLTRIGLNYPHMFVDILRVDLTDTRLTLNRRPDHINLQSTRINRCEQTEGMQSWRGLTIYQHYLQH